MITDKIHFLETIIDVIDVKNTTSLSPTSFEAFKKIFLADPYNFDEKAFDAVPILAEPTDQKLHISLLREDQRFALTQIGLFLKDSEKQIFVLQGTLNSGKSHLIPYIRDLAYQSGIEESEIFAASARVAKNLLSSVVSEKVHSIYSYIYGGNVLLKIDDVEKDDESLLKHLKVVPLKQCDNEENTLFIVDESHLISDSYHQTIDVKFGSGHLLKDFIEFSDLKRTKRKIIFIGDPYQLQLGNIEKSPLNPRYLEENFQLGVSTVQLLDNEEYSNLNRQALKCVQSMRQQKYNSLDFLLDDHLCTLKNDEVLTTIKKIVLSQIKCPILTFSNEEASKINSWIKSTILHNGDDIAAGDLISFHNNISIEGNSPIDLPVKIYNGEFATVESITSNIIPDPITPKGKTPVQLKFKEIRVKLHSNNRIQTVFLLENFRLNPKAELSDDETIAFKILLNNFANLTDEEYDLICDEKIVSLRQQLKDGKKVKTKLQEATKAILERTPSSKYYKFKNVAFIRFGWAMTVHRSMAYKFDKIIINVDQGKNGSRNTESYFRWLYTGLSRAKEKVFLRQYVPITSFENVEINEKNSTVKSKDIFFESDNLDKAKRLEELKEYVIFKVSSANIVLKRVESLDRQERYFMSDVNGQEIVLNFWYSNDGHFNMPLVMKSQSEEFKNYILNFFTQKEAIQSLDFIHDYWRRDAYNTLSQLLSDKNIQIDSITQSPYHDQIKLFGVADELEVDIYYDGAGLFTKISPKYYNKPIIWDTFKEIIETIKQRKIDNGK